MNLTSQKTIKELLLKYGASPLKTMGQNFLINASVLQKIIQAAELGPDDIVVEVGPGIGTLTKELAQRAKRVIAIEKDKKMVEILQETLKDCKNVEVINGDILKISNLKLQISNSDYKVVCNIPYYLTSLLIRKFLESSNPPTEMVLMVQKEVAQRICAKPPHMSLLAVSVQFYANAKVISYVKKESFWPSPKVDSAIIKIIPHNSALNSASFPDDFFKVVKAGFAQPRKQLINNLTHYLTMDKDKTKQWLIENNIQPEQRAETLSLSDWQSLVKTRTFRTRF